MNGRGTCSWCALSIQLRQNGSIGAHPFRGEPCLGAGEGPTTVEYALRRRLAYTEQLIAMLWDLPTSSGTVNALDLADALEDA